MAKRQKNILIWIITWAGLLLMVLYSPIGSPDLYSPKKYFTAHQGVEFNGEVIENSPLIKMAEGNNNQELNIPVSGSIELKNTATYAVANSSDNLKADNYAVQAGGSFSSTQKNSNSVVGSAGMGGNLAVYTGKTSKQNANTPTTGFMSLTTDLNSLTNNTTTSQSVNNYTAGSGATDPGSDDPLGPPIPVGDGWITLLVLGVCYALYKKYFSGYFVTHGNKGS